VAEERVAADGVGWAGPSLEPGLQATASAPAAATRHLTK